jgi:hypothetical protein
MDRKLLSTIPGSVDQPFLIGNTLRARNAPQTEQRHSLRRPLNLEVLVNYGLTYSVPWHVRDLSMQGAYIEIESGPLAESAYLEVVLRFQYKGERLELRLPATVERVEGKGMAVRFGYYDDDAYTHLTNLLYAL